MKTLNLNNLPTRYNVLVGFEKAVEWHGWLVNLHQYVLKKGNYPKTAHCFVCIKLPTGNWLYCALTWDGIQFETIISPLLADELLFAVPLTCKLTDIEDRLQILDDASELLGKSFRYSPLGCLDNDAWLNCSSFVSTILGLGHISTPSELATLLLGDNHESI
jgi:hypothetical protein